MREKSALDAWPKVRPDLPDAYGLIYAEHMHGNRSGGSLLNKTALWLEEWMHRAVSRPRAARVLELGAGNLNHVRFEPLAEHYSVVEPLMEVVESSRRKTQVPIDYLGDYSDLLELARSSDITFDKVLSVAVLEHLEDLPAVVSAASLLLAPEGCFLAGIPSEGGRLWSTAWRSTTGRAFRKRYGLDYATLMRWEHINTAPEIEFVARSIFDDVRITRFPGPTLDTSLYTCLTARSPRREVATRILDSRP